MVYEDRFRRCDVCDERIGAKGYIYHHRLDYRVCENCPLDDVKGHDIRLDTVFWYRPYTVLDATIEERGDFD